jgi:large subunit ribosomal protein L9
MARVISDCSYAYQLKETDTSMKVLFLQDVKGTARAGDLKDVSEGFARNFLLPKSLAVPATTGALKNVAYQKQISVSKTQRIRSEHETLAARLTATRVTFKVKVGEQYRLFGSITSTDVAEAVEKAIGQEIDKHKVILDEPIKHLGIYKVPIKVGDLDPTVTVVVEDEAGVIPTPEAAVAAA